MEFSQKTASCPKSDVLPGTVRPDTWAAVDGLGRTVSSAEQVGLRRKGKFVGCFYWIWHTFFSYTEPRCITPIINAHPEAKNDFNHPAWENTPNYTPYFWDKPLLGYYQSVDEFVIRKHAELLADAGVDVIIFDCSNGTLTFPQDYAAVFRVFDRARADGINVPKIAFLLNFFDDAQTKEQLENIYTDIYKEGKYSELWFLWEGKPLIMARQSALDAKLPHEMELQEFFTFRLPVPTYFDDDYTYDRKAWGWCSVYPQTKFGVREDGTVEQMCVSVAQNANEYGLCAMNDARGGVFGRGYAKGDYSYSYTYKGKTIVVDKQTKDAYLYGLNFQQQWDYALATDPDFIFITGWNEYVVQRTTHWYGSENGCSDNFTAAYSRDIEPSGGILKDYFYYQLVENIRRFKGVDVQEAASEDNHAFRSIDIYSEQDEWESVGLSYNHYIAGTPIRDADGYKGVHYKSNTLRNNIITGKVAYDEQYIYFMAETRNALTPCTDPAWMRLLICSGSDKDGADWEGFNYIINRVPPKGTEAIVEKFVGGWNFEAVGAARFRAEGNRLQLAVPRKILHLDGNQPPKFNFKWADNTRADGVDDDSGDILDFYQYGNVAPGGRFMFTFKGTV